MPKLLESDFESVVLSLLPPKLLSGEVSVEYAGLSTENV